MPPAMLGAHAHRRFILMDERALVQSGFELALQGSQLLMASLNEASDAAYRQLAAIPVLARTRKTSSQGERASESATNISMYIE